MTAFVLVACACSSSASYRRCPPTPPQQLALMSQKLSGTGLFAPGSSDVAAEGVRAFTPRFELWSDGATKRRFIELPEGAAIDTSDMDAWRFPTGTKIWKEFTRDGVRVETRLLEKIGDGDEQWLAGAYLWDESGDATLVPDGAVNARSTAHDVPSAAQCMGCHGGTASRVLGFSAVQLPFRTSDGQISIESLVADARLTAPPPEVELPGNESVQRGLGYLHANCAHCHNGHRPAPPQGADRCFDPRRDVDLSLRTDALARVEQTAAYRSGLGKLIVPGDTEASRLFQRARGDLEVFQARMPPLGTELTDPDILPILRAFIDALPAAEEE